MNMNMNQPQNQNLTGTSAMPAKMSHGGHELLDAHEAIGGLVGGLEQYMIYEQHVQDQQLKTIMQQHKTFLTQMYNTLVETLKTGNEPSVKTQTYNMTTSNDVVYGMTPSQPKKPAQSINEINDECITSFMMGCLKSSASAFTMAALESTNPVMRRVFADSIPNLIEMAYEVFLYQNKHQYYQVPQLNEADMQNYLNGFAPIQGKMPH
ncbi:spore coat protein [Ornithinibacillus bavariensis]|uniref:Spore coat protein F-like protein YhcQ n=1 Tax=Ornithinibacillus bavariensis TaxID=545502 RepID=A0A919X9B0_9BACI|nr:spore coat protein [Ornithinibacillus bavariensis]GIO27218.1 spore coat protein F-like protein YhcQ [Ornithinibacillus bavariensis]HAM81540.1 spore coat protein [Ornithinibacillus sp.]